MRIAPETVKQNVANAIREDVGSGDINAALIPADRRARARILTRDDGVLCGTPWANEAIRQIDASVKATWHAGDGDRVAAGSTILELEGSARSLLTMERTIVNFVQFLSSAATDARRFVDAVAHTDAVILDTRKTIPGLREAQKFAVVAGGAENHRMGLFDAYLLKENHIAAAGSISAAVEAARAQHPDVKLEVEVENDEQLQETIDAGADMALLDNYTPAQMKTAVERTAGRIPLEASGGITLTDVADYAETGVDYISIGHLTKNVEPMDLSMRITEIV